MALATHHINAIVREVYDQGYFGDIAERLIERAIGFASTRAYSSVARLVDTAARNFIERGYVSGRTEDPLSRKIGIKYGFADPVTEERPQYKRGRVEGKAAKQLFTMSSSGYIQRNDRKYEYRLGRKLSRTKKIMRDLSGHAQTVVERFQGNQANTASDTARSLLGQYVLSCGPYTAMPVPGTAGPTTISARQLPFFCFDLTSAYNNNRSTAFTRPSVMYQCVFDTGTGTARFLPVAGRDLDDNTDLYSWQVERIGTGATSGLDVVGDKAHIDSVKVNFSFMGARNLPSTVYIELWTFTDKDIPPGVVTWNTGDLLSNYERDDDFEEARRRTYWVARAKNMLGLNNQQFHDSDVLKGTYIKRLKTLKFQPTSTTESDPNGHVRNVEMFIELNKTVDMRWPDVSNGNINLAFDLANPDEYEVCDGNTLQRPYPEFNRSTYLVVRADVNQEHATTFSSLADTAKQNLFPSFDVVMRRYRTQIKI